MCLKPIRIRNRSKYIDIHSNCRVYQYVPCGQCPECQQAKSNEWKLRLFEEYEDTILNKNGYVLFDTLTYNEDTVPYASQVLKRKYNIDIPKSIDFRCFDFDDVQDFLKRLREHYEDRDCEIKYFIAGEYGKRNTRRPHYHCLFFVKGIEPADLSHQINEKWKKGRTDGIDTIGSSWYNGRAIINEYLPEKIKAFKYVSKYVEKDMAYHSHIQYRLGKILKYFGDIDPMYKYTYQGRLRTQSIKRNLNQFHRQSQQFGINLLNKIDLQSLKDSNMKVYIPDDKKVKVGIQLPLYYYRKMFQYKVKTDDGYTWIDNIDGEKIKKFKEDNCVSNYAKSVYNKWQNYTTEVKQEINDYLGKRNLFDFSNYVQLKKDRLNIGKCNKKIHCIQSFTSRESAENIGFYAIQPSYKTEKLVSYDYFFENKKYIDADFEEILRIMYQYDCQVAKMKTAKYLEEQRLKTIFK